MLCFLGSDGCPSEPQSPLCTCGVLSASLHPCLVDTSSSAPQSSPTHSGPMWFSLSGERCRGLGSFRSIGGKLCPFYVVLSGPLAVLVVHLHPCLPAFVRVITITVVTSTLFSTSQTRLHRHHLCWDRRHACFTGCDHRLQASCMVLPLPEPLALPVVFFPTLVPSASSRPSLSEESRPRRFWALGPCCPCFFWKLVTNSLIWSVLQHLFAKAFCRARVKPWLIKKAVKDSVVVTWAGLVGRVRCICFFTSFGAPAPSAGWGSSSEEYSNTTFLSALLPGLESFFGSFFPLPIANSFPPVFFLQFALYVPCSKETSTSRLYGKGSMLGEGTLQFYIETADHMIS